MITNHNGLADVLRAETIFYLFLFVATEMNAVLDTFGYLECLLFYRKEFKATIT